jgi:hypothetical protein
MASSTPYLDVVCQAPVRAQPRSTIKEVTPKAVAVRSTVIKDSLVVGSACSLDKNLLPTAGSVTVGLART